MGQSAQSQAQAILVTIEGSTYALAVYVKEIGGMNVTIHSAAQLSG